MTSRPVALGIAATLTLVVLGLWGWVFYSGNQDEETALPPASTVGATASATSSAPRSASLRPARAAVARDGSSVVVLGDATGIGSGGWVQQWSDGRDVQVATWDGETRSYDDSFGARVYSGSKDDATSQYAIAEWPSIWPDNDPDLVIVNYGNDYSDPETAVAGMDSLYTKITKEARDTRVVVTLQPPQRDDAGADIRQAITRWARERGLPTIDVAAAFTSASKNTNTLLEDTTQPNARGQRIWVQAVDKALGT